jgi:hypothetical protein
MKKALLAVATLIALLFFFLREPKVEGDLESSDAPIESSSVEGDSPANFSKLGSSSSTAPLSAEPNTSSSGADLSNANRSKSESRSTSVQSARADDVLSENPLRASDMIAANPYLVNASKPVIEKGGTYEEAFPATGLGHSEESSFGYIDVDVLQPVEFLRSKLSLNGGEALIGLERRSKNLFFQATLQKGFRGYLLDPSGKVSFGRMDVFFAVDGKDAIRAYQDKATFEAREISTGEVGLWRFDLDKKGINLMQSRCPWSADYSFERKQFFFVKNGSQLLANIYCGKIEGGQSIWKFVAHYTAEEI